VGFNYLRALLTPLIERMKHTEPDNSPSTIAELSQLILDDLTRTMDVPGPVRQVLGLVSAATMTKFPEARSQAVASFLVLRVLCPAIISPERLDLQISADHRRTLVQISKVIINVANNQYFAAKEMQLLSLNDFIGKNVGSIAQAMTELGSHAPLSGSPSGFDEDVHVTRSTDPLAIEADEAYLRYYITKKERRVALAKNSTVENFIPLIELLRRTPAGTVNSAMDRTESYNEWVSEL
jgi:neurofibromin 1